MTIPQAPFPVTLTEEAAEKVLEALQENNLNEENTWLQVGILGGGCAGYQYNMDFKEGPLPDDWTTDVQHGVKMASDPISATMLPGTTIEFVSGLMGSGFKFVNPNAQRHCGCGMSFA